MPSFHCNARFFLVTYAQCATLDPWAIVAHFAGLEAECIVARESHADGGTHLHVFVDFARKFQSRRTDIFDVDGYHPNIEASKGRPEHGYDYAIKEGDVVAGGLERPTPRHNGVVDKWSVLAGAETDAEFWQLARELAPRELICNYPAMRKYADNQFKRTVGEYVTPNSVTIDTGTIPELDYWRAQNLRVVEGR